MSYCQFFRYRTQRGVTLIEALIVVVILGILLSIGLPAYEEQRREGQFSVAIADMKVIEAAITNFELMEYELPDSLAEAGIGDLEDPWGNPYQYLRIEGAGLKGKGKVRKDKFLNPVNSDYDLYSMGEDGRSVSPFTAKHSRDDVVRAGNGAFFGRAKDF